jgi:acyl-CoA dehydrogenase
MVATLFFFGAALAVAVVIGIRRTPLWAWALLVGVSTLLLDLGHPAGVLPVLGGPVIALFGWALTLALALLCIPQVRRVTLTAPLYRYMKRIMPAVSATEQEALDAGDVGFDAEFFSGDPDWRKLAALRPPALTDEERAFLDGPTEELCAMLNDWEIRHEKRDIPSRIWKFVAEKGFLGMLISKEHGGLGFSPKRSRWCSARSPRAAPTARRSSWFPIRLGRANSSRSSERTSRRNISCRGWPPVRRRPASP